MKKIFASALLAAVCGSLSASAPQFAPADSWQKAPWHPGAKHFNCMKVENNIVTLSKDDASTLSFSPAKALAADLQAGQKMRFSIDFKGSGAPKNYEYAMVLEIVYTDNTKEKWHYGSVFIPLPKKLDEFKTFTAQYVAAKPVKHVFVRFLFNGKFNVQLKNPVFTVDSDSEKAAFNQGNMLENCDFEYVNGSLQGWSFQAKAPTTVSIKDGVINAEAKSSLFLLESKEIVPADANKPIKFGFEADIKAKPKSWRYIAIVDALYTDGSRSKWTIGTIKLKNTNGFAKFEETFTPDKPIKNFRLKIFFEATGTIKIRRPFAVTEQSSKGAAPAVQSSAAKPAKKAAAKTVRKTTAAAAVIPGNRAPNSALIYEDGKLEGWTAIPKYMTALDNGGFTVKLPAQAGFTISSQTIELNQTKPTTIRYGVSYKGKNFPVSYHHGLLLDKVVYMDGTTEGWGATHFIFRFQSEDWSKEATAWMPPKPVKSLRLYFIFKSTADAEFSLKDVFLKEDPEAFSTANAKLNFDDAPTNLVSNGNFEIINAGDPKNWIPFYESHPLNMSLKRQINVAIDKNVKRSGNYSLLLSNSLDSIAGIESTVTSIIDYTREFTFSGWVKAEKATGNTFLEVKFMRNWAPCGIGSAAGNELNRVYHRADTVGVYRTPITAGTHDWKRLAVTMRPPEGANLVTFRVFSINNTGKVWVDDLNFDGFGNAPTEILYSQLGYPADGTKTAILRSRKELDGTFELLNDKQQSVFKGTLKKRNQDIWNCCNNEADFSSYTVPGKYKVRFQTADGTFTSGEFEIRKDFYASIIESSRYFMYHMRCGFDIPNFHKACHLDDGQIRSKNNLLAGGKVIGHHDSSGGWHDAGDYDKFPGPTIQCAVHFSRFGKRFNDPALLDEAAWGAKWHNKIATPKGVYYQFLRLAPNGSIIIDLCPPESESDNIPGNADDRVIIGPGHDIMVPWALAEHALATNDPAFREKCFKTSKMLYDDFLSSKKTSEKNFYMFNSSMLVKTDLAYYKLTGDKKYFEHALPFVDATVNMVIERIKQNRWSGIFEAHFYPWSWGIMPLEFATDYPQEAVSQKIKKEYKVLVDSIVKHLQASPHGFVEHSNWNYHFHNGYGSTGHSTITNLSIATLMARAAVLYNDPEMLALAERCFHYITGINELAASQISGFGSKTVTCWVASNAVPGYANGQPIKGAVLKGVTRWSGTARILPSYLSGGKSDYAIDHPAGYPAMMIAGDFPMAGGPGSQELWESLNGSTLRAIEAILDAREFFNRK